MLLINNKLKNSMISLVYGFNLPLSITPLNLSYKVIGYTSNINVIYHAILGFRALYLVSMASMR
jgi:hypothetical protein